LSELEVQEHLIVVLLELMELIHQLELLILVVVEVELKLEHLKMV
tara:strand:- start:441 stop:575 length:135 start_codon:yes stop_codon:yes gene_type:complete